jgi:Transglutaminase-like superfamily
MTADRTAPDRPAAGLEPAGRHRRRHRVRPPAASVTGRLADATHPAVRDAAARLAEGCASPRQQLERFVLFVRDDIRFGFPPDGDLTAASGTLALGIGQCNTKGTLLLALCRAAGIPARLHFAPIRRSIQRGLYTGVWYLLLPRHLSHAWLEVSIDGRWRPVDAYINDTRFCRAAERELRRRGWREGFSLSGTCAGAGGAFDVDASSFIQMDAVEGDDGVWDEPAGYFRSTRYRNRAGPVRTWLYHRIAPRINRKIDALRAASPAGEPPDREAPG